MHELLSHADWLRRLATHLVGDEGEDAVQDTWMAALRSPPAGDASQARPWLAEVLRNFVRRRWRSASARQAREQAAAPPLEAAAASPEDLLGRAQLQQTMAGLVLALDEPFRSTVLLRYYEGNSAAEIARALGVPAGTVRWRLKEGIDRLRRRLDAVHG